MVERPAEAHVQPLGIGGRRDVDQIVAVAVNVDARACAPRRRPLRLLLKVVDEVAVALCPQHLANEVRAVGERRLRLVCRLRAPPTLGDELRPHAVHVAH